MATVVTANCLTVARIAIKRLRFASIDLNEPLNNDPSSLFGKKNS